MAMIIIQIQISGIFSYLTMLKKLYDYAPMAYADRKIRTINPYFDRLVAVSLTGDNPGAARPEFVTIAPGVLFNKDHVLTSFNPFRKLSKTRKTLERMRVNALQYRVWIEANPFVNRSFFFYGHIEKEITCARQVMPIREEDLTEDQWFGTNRLHSPVHDLMVLRVDSEYDVITNLSIVNFTPWPGYVDKVKLTAGPLLSALAQPDDFLGREITFGSIGYIDDLHIWKSYDVHTRSYQAEDNALVNCDRWFPRDWGYFICVKNLDKFAGVGSGAVLVYNGTVFGIGSFMLEKANESILAFTDVRKYAELINITCTAYDGGVQDSNSNSKSQTRPKQSHSKYPTRPKEPDQSQPDTASPRLPLG